jgi:hypothetical protein
MNLQESLEQKVARLKLKLAQIEENFTGTTEETNNRNWVSNQLSEAEDELQKQRAMEVREQKTEEMLDEYNDTLNRIFNVIMPEDVFSQVLGVNEYSEKRSDFKKIMRAYYSEKLAALNADHAAEIDAWRKKFGRLTMQAQQTENQLAEQKSNSEKKESEWAESEEKYEAEIREKELLLNQTQTLLNLANDRFAELEAKLEQATKPKEAAPSEALDKVLEEVQSRKKLNTDEIMKRFEARQTNGGKVMAIDHSKIVLPELPFRTNPEVVAPPVGQSADIPTIVTPEQFRGSNANVDQQAAHTEDGNGAQGDNGSSPDDAPVSRAELEARFKRIESQLGLKLWQYEAEVVA